MTTATPAPADIATIVRQVIAELSNAGSPAAPPSVASGPVGANSFNGAHGIFSTVDEAVRAAQEAVEAAGDDEAALAAATAALRRAENRLKVVDKTAS